MNKINVVTIIGIVLLIVGLSGALFLDYTATDLTSLVATFVGAGMVLYSLLKKKENKSWKDYVFLILIAVGSILFVFGGFDKDTILTVVGAIITVVGAILSILFKKQEEKA